MVISEEILEENSVHRCFVLTDPRLIEMERYLVDECGMSPDEIYFSGINWICEHILEFKLVKQVMDETGKTRQEALDYILSMKIEGMNELMEE